MNKVILMGRLTRDPEVRYTQTNNTVVASFSLAVNFKKGQQVGVIGRIQTRTWDDDQGTKHYVTEVVAEEAYFADSKREGDANGSFENTFGDTAPGNMGADFEVSSSDDLPF